MEFQVREGLAVPPEAAFDLLADLRNQAHWSSTPIDLQLLTGEPVGPDSRFEATQGGRSYTARFTTYSRPERILIEVRGAHLQVDADVRFTPDDGGTVLEATIEVSAKGPMRLALPAYRGRIAAELPNQTAAFAHYCRTRSVV